MGDPKQTLPELYRLSDVCAVLGIGRSTVYKLVETDPEFPAQVRVTSRAVRWRRVDIEQWAHSRPVAKTQSRDSPEREAAD